MPEWRLFGRVEAHDPAVQLGGRSVPVALRQRGFFGDWSPSGQSPSLWDGLLTFDQGTRSGGLKVAESLQLAASARHCIEQEPAHARLRNARSIMAADKIAVGNPRHWSGFEVRDEDRNREQHGRRTERCTRQAEESNRTFVLEQAEHEEQDAPTITIGIELADRAGCAGDVVRFNLGDWHILCQSVHAGSTARNPATVCAIESSSL